MSSVKRHGTASGSLPEKLAVVLRTKHLYKTPGGEYKIQAAMVTDAVSAGSLETAKRWADGWGDGKTKNPDVVNVDNKPIPEIRVIDLDARSEGGRAWKVVTPEGWYVDLREDVILDAFKARCPMVNHPDGGLVIEGPFLWVKYGTQMRLALMDSDLFREIAVSDQMKNTPKISVNNLEVGGLYMSASRKCGVYLGRVLFKGKKATAWIEIPNYRWAKDMSTMTQAEIQEEYNKSAGYEFRAKVTSSFLFTTKVGSVVTRPNPEKWFKFSGSMEEVVDPVETAKAVQANYTRRSWDQIKIPVLTMKLTKPLAWL